MSSRKWTKSENCCYYRSPLEKILIASSIVVLVIILILLILLLVPSNDSNLEKNNVKCTSTECLRQASHLIETIDQETDPCQNFYQFSCGKLLENAHGDENLGPFFLAQEKSQRGIYEMYNQSIQSGDHGMVKKAKTLYSACVNLAEENESLVTIRKMFHLLGGWPVIKGNYWNDAAFEWIQVTYKLRQFGYFWASLLQLSVEIDPNNGNKHILQVSLPTVELLPKHTQIQEKIEKMVEMAVKFGAKSETALIEMTEMYDFMFDLQRISSRHGNGEPLQRITVAECQKNYKKINWLELINRLVGPSVKIFRDDYILFPLPHTIHRWLKFLANAPKRTLANYMIWKALEDLIPYIRKNLTLNENESESIKLRSEYCAAEVRKRFRPSPIDVLYLRQNLPQDKVDKIKAVMENIKFEFLNLLYENDLVNSKEKLVAMERIKQMDEIIGAPINYYDDNVLDDLDVDMIELKSNDSVSLVLQANRNHQSWTFGEMYNSVQEAKENHFNLQTASVIGDYLYEDNLLVLPVSLLQDDIFDPNQPMFKNYASIGIIMGHHFLYAIENPQVTLDEEESPKQSSKLYKNQSECFYNQTISLNTTREQMGNLLLYQSLGLKASYEAYKKLSKLNELEILSFNYTIYQMFWISAATYFCQPSNIYTEERQLFPFMVMGLTSNSDDFPQDFHCHLNSRDKCKFL